MFNPSKFQPLSVYFDFEVGGLSRIYEYPNIPVAMELTLATKEASTVVFSLYDEAAREVEPYLWQSRDPATGFPGGSFEFGYKGEANVSSKRYTFQISDVNPVEDLNSGFHLTIYGFITSATPISSSNQLCGTVEEVLEEFCKIHDFDLVVEPQFDKTRMTDIGKTNRNTTEKQEMKFVKFMTESDWRFINRVLTFCVDQENKPGYVAKLVDNDNGKKTLKIVKARDTTADYKYIVRDPETVCIRWSPKVSYAPLLDEADVHFNGHQSHSGYEFKQVMTPSLTKDSATLFGKDVYQVRGALPQKDTPSKIDHICAEQMEDQVVNGSIRQRRAPTRTGFGGSIPTLNSHIRRWMDLNSAELTIFGDPQIDSVAEEAITLVEVDYKIAVNYFNKDSNITHYTSGIYPVDSVVHRIEAGTYQTIYNLGRPMFWEEPKPGEAHPKAGGN